MKKIAILLLGCIWLYQNASAQTNWFPSSGNVGVGTQTPNSYMHGGNNVVLEVFNPNTSPNSQSHVILTTNANVASSSVGSISWMSTGFAGNNGVAWIGAQTVGAPQTNASGSLVFGTANHGAPTVKMIINDQGNVGIGTMTPDVKLAVNGNIRAKEVKVETANWPDYVFAPAYTLMPLTELETYIKLKGHLPKMEPAKDLEAKGLGLGEMVRLQQEKIEELTLHLIEKEKQIQQQNRRLEKIEALLTGKLKR